MREPAEGISVIVCCYNSSERIRPTLRHLFAQKISGFDWEIIVVDNNSSDQTSRDAEKTYAESKSETSFKIVSEPRPGLSNARQAGFEASNYNIALMVDDDNWLSPDYLQGIWNSFMKDESIGMVGGLGLPELADEAPDWFERYAYCYATGPQTEDGNSGFADHLYGAGLALRLSALDRLKQCGFESLLSDRVGTTLLSGGDTELCYAFRMAGYKLYYDSKISFKHELPASRINWKYLRQLFYGFGVTKSRLDIYTACLSGKPMPGNGRFPFWFNRAFFLWKNSMKDQKLLLASRFLNLEGNDNLLVAMANSGQIDGIVSMRTEYLIQYQKVYELKARLQR